MGHNIDPLALVTQTNELTHEVGLITGIMVPIITSESGSLLNLVFKITGTTGAIVGSTFIEYYTSRHPMPSDTFRLVFRGIVFSSKLLLVSG